MARVVAAHTADQVIHDAPVPVLLAEPSARRGRPKAAPWMEREATM
jgi:hypothetical protein